MPSNPSEPTPPRPVTVPSRLARLHGMAEASTSKPEEGKEEVRPTWNTPDGAEIWPAAAALPDAPSEAASLPEALPVAEPVDQEAALAAPLLLPPEEPPPPMAEAVPAPQLCPHCQWPRADKQTYCENCGWIFPPTAAEAEPPVAGPAATPAMRLRGRYELEQLQGERAGVARYRGRDFGAGGGPVPVTMLRAALPALPAAPSSQSAAEDATSVPRLEAVSPAPASDSGGAEQGHGPPLLEEPEANRGPEPPVAGSGHAEAEILPSFDDRGALPSTEPLPEKPAWPTLAWEGALLHRAAHAALPDVLDNFMEDGFEYLVEEVPTGQPLWDAWDDEGATAEKRFGWLKQIAELLDHLHGAGAMLEGLRPEVVVITPAGQARLADLSDLLPLPLPPNPPIRATLDTAPELVLASDQADARADLYHFGAMLYALHVGRELAEMDFDREGMPKPFIPRFPDVHPLFGRLMSKTFCREVDARFPTDEAGKEDATGFQELIHTLDVCGRTLDNVRLEIAAWATTGMLRTGNEDAFALLHAVESHGDELGEAALVFLADGMGGYEAGEVAAAIAIQALRKYLLQQPAFAFLAGRRGASSAGSPQEEEKGTGTFAAEHPSGLTATPQACADAAPPGSRLNGLSPFPPARSVDIETCKQLLAAALKDANQQVYTAARSGVGRRGMGCTAEVVYVDSRHVVVGHVGDSRTYHLHQGRLLQMTRDQTLVNRLVELGTLTLEEAETHPRRSELQQAIGGHADVEPALYQGSLKPSDWVVVCSDGLSNHITADELKQMLQSEATSAEMAARRLVNFANIKGATDNATVVVLRAT